MKLLVESKKIEFLGNLVAGLAHEVNTPIGVVLTAISFIEDAIRDLKTAYEGGSLTKSSLSHFFEESLYSSKMVKDNLDTTIKLINRFKMISSNFDINVKSEFDLVGI